MLCTPVKVWITAGTARKVACWESRMKNKKIKSRFSDLVSKFSGSSQPHLRTSPSYSVSHWNTEESRYIPRVCTSGVHALHAMYLCTLAFQEFSCYIRCVSTSGGKYATINIFFSSPRFDYPMASSHHPRTQMHSHIHTQKIWIWEKSSSHVRDGGIGMDFFSVLNLAQMGTGEKIRKSVEKYPSLYVKVGIQGFF